MLWGLTEIKKVRYNTAYNKLRVPFTMTVIAYRLFFMNLEWEHRVTILFPHDILAWLPLISALFTFKLLKSIDHLPGPLLPWTFPPQTHTIESVHSPLFTLPKLPWQRHVSRASHDLPMCLSHVVCPHVCSWHTSVHSHLGLFHSHHSLNINHNK